MRASRETVESESIDVERLATHFDRSDAGELPWEEASDLAVARAELEQISLRLPKDDFAALRARAARTGVGYTTLIRMILRQHLRNPLSR